MLKTIKKKTVLVMFSSVLALSFTLAPISAFASTPQLYGRLNTAEN